MLFLAFLENGESEKVEAVSVFLKCIFFEAYIGVWKKPFPDPNVQTISG
jgi:hypothetical protein